MNELLVWKNLTRRTIKTGKTWWGKSRLRRLSFLWKMKDDPMDFQWDYRHTKGHILYKFPSLCCADCPWEEQPCVSVCVVGGGGMNSIWCVVAVTQASWQWILDSTESREGWKKTEERSKFSNWKTFGNINMEVKLIYSL